jgi:hypothetical protein
VASGGGRQGARASEPEGGAAGLHSDSGCPGAGSTREVEQGLFKRLLELGYPLQQGFFAWLGHGDQGETVTPGEGWGLRRLPRPHRRAYQAIFGPLELERVVYGTCEGQRVEHLPLEARGRLPGGKFSYRLQDGDPGLAAESPYQQVTSVLQRMWGLEPSVASFEPMRQVVGLSADSKGVPRRQPAAAPPRAAHQPPKGPKPGRKKRAGVGTVYPSDRPRRTPQEVVQALFRAPGAAAPREEAAPSRAVPEHKRVRVHLTGPEAAPPVGGGEVRRACGAGAPPRPGAAATLGGDQGRAAVGVGGGRAGPGRGPPGGELGPASGYQPPRGGGASVLGPGEGRGAQAEGARGMGPALGDERGGGEWAGGRGGGGGAKQEPTATGNQDVPLSAPSAGPAA